MQPIHDADVILLLAIALSAKRRPADLGEIFAAIDLISDSPPGETKLVAAFTRLSAHGLIEARDGGIALTDAAEAVVSNSSRKSTMEERLFSVREQLGIYRPAVQSAESEPPTPINFTEAELTEAQAVLALEKKNATRNLLMPKPKPPAEKTTGPGFRQRKPLPAKRRKFFSGR